MKGEKAYYGSVAKNYEADRVHQTIWNKEQEYISNIVKNFNPGSKILDIPCGTGRFLPIYADQKLSITAADISEDMLTEAKKKEVPSNAPIYSIEDASKLSFDDNSFDVVICWRLTHLVQPDKLKKILAEFSRVTQHKIIVQFFYIEDKSHGVISQVIQIMKNLCTRAMPQNKPSTPWDGIKTYIHTRKDIEHTASLCKLKIHSVSSIEDEANRELIYVFEKTSSKHN